MADRADVMRVSRRSVVAMLGASATAPGLAASTPVPGRFAQRAKAAPVIAADANAVFHCPMRDAPVRWRALHAFDPAAVVHDGAVHVLFRAEDDSGAMAIGGHTSRVGLARSGDGVNFEVLSSPVIYPAADS